MALRSLISSSRVLHQFVRKYSNSPETKLVALSVNDKSGVSTIALQRPPVNGLNLDLLTDLSNVLDYLEKTKCRGAILTSASDGVFSAGLDILEMYKPDPDRVKIFWTTLQNTWIKLYGSSFPTVAVINGHSPAGGCLLSLSCEYRIMLNNFTIGLNETQLGLVAPKWFIAPMKETIGQRHSELALTQGRLFSTQEAIDIGLIDEVATSKEDGLAKADVYFSKFAKVSPIARALTKQSIREETLTSMVQNREADLKTFLGFVHDEKTQKSLGLYLEALRKRVGK